jgi:hypothetical protein
MPVQTVTELEKKTMNRTWNFRQRVGGAGSLASAQGVSRGVPPSPPKSCAMGNHKWLLRKWSRKCNRCGLEQTKDALGVWEDGKVKYKLDPETGRYAKQ